MEAMREAWTDERLDRFEAQVNLFFGGLFVVLLGAIIQPL